MPLEGLLHLRKGCIWLTIGWVEMLENSKIFRRPPTRVKNFHRLDPIIDWLNGRGKILEWPSRGKNVHFRIFFRPPQIINRRPLRHWTTAIVGTICKDSGHWTSILQAKSFFSQNNGLFQISYLTILQLPTSDNFISNFYWISEHCCNICHLNVHFIV